MKKFDLISISVSLVVCLISYIASNNLIIGIALMALYIAYYFLIARKLINNYITKKNKAHSCYHFISSFLITLSIKESLSEAFESGIRNPDQSLQSFVNQLNEMNIDEKIKSLSKFYNYSIYQMFINVINLYNEQGGNVLKISNSLLSENTRIEETVNASTSISRKKAVEFIILWALAFAVVLFMRFSLSAFYFKMLSSIVFVVLLVTFFLLCLLSIHLFLIRLVKLPIKEETERNE